MDNYDKAKSMISDALALDDVVDNDEVISAYTLYNMVNDRFNDLRSIQNDEELNNKITSLYRKRSIKDFFKSKKYQLHPNFSGKKMEIRISNGINKESEYLCKDVGENHFYCDKYNTMIGNDIINGCIVEIYNIFDILEEYFDLLCVVDNKGDVYCNYNDIYSFIVDDYFDCYIKYDYNGNVNHSIRIKGLDYYFDNRNWYGDKNNSKDNINKYLDDISPILLKKFPISVATLHDVFKKIYDENNIKQKVYSK